jgi:stage II sporulation protein D
VNALRSGVHALLALAVVLGLTAAALVAYRPKTAAEPPPLDVRPIPAPLRQSASRSFSSDRDISSGREIRVCLTSSAADSVRIKVNRGTIWRTLDSGRVLDTSRSAKESTFTSTQDGLSDGERRFPSARVEIVPETSPGVWVDGRLVRGRVRLISQPDGRLIAVNVIPLEDYVASVVDGEMPAAFPIEARRAQAVVARTYALARQAVANRDAEFDVYGSERSQKYLGVEYTDRNGRRLAGESDGSRRIARDTAGLVLTYDGQIFTSYYSAVCGGCTTTGDELFPDAAPCHRSVTCEFCREAERYRWQARFSAGEFREAVNSLDRGRLGTIRRVRMTTPPGHGELARLEVRDDRRAVELSGWNLRQASPSGRLLSPHVTVQLIGNEIVVEGRGHGHGVGFCQWGARGQALAGRSWKQIVQHYYPGAAVQTLPR